jgi:hypothetical protein
MASLAVTGDDVSMLNPATLHTITRTRVWGGFEYAYISSSDASATSGYSRGDFQGLAVAIPIDAAHGAVLAAGAGPYSRVLYAIKRTESAGGSEASQVFHGSGGLSTLSLSGSFRLSPSIVAGAGLQYLYGRIRQIHQIDFLDPLFTDSNIDRSWFHSGFFVSGGLVVRNVGTLLGIRRLEALDLGILYSSPASLDVQEERLVTSTSFSDTSLVRSGTTRIPSRFGVGAAYVVSERVLLAADVMIQRWRSANFFSQPNVDMMRDSWRAGAGIEFRPARDRYAFGDRLYYRLGAAYTTGNLKLSNQLISEVMVTAGVGVPIGPLAYLNIGLQGGRRGVTDAPLVQDTFLRVSLSVVGGEEWFMDLIED